jgi:hypothetical protein
MSDIAAMASSILAMNQSRVQDQISVSILRMNAQADQAMVDMLTQNALQIQSLSNTSNKHIDLLTCSFNGFSCCRTKLS